MSKVGKWSTTPGSNNATPPDGWPEGQAPSTVNDCAREMMAQIRTLINDAQYIDQDFTPTYISATSFSVAGDQTSAIHAGRRLKIFDATAGAATTIYATVVTASYTTVTTVSISADAGQLTSSLSSFAIAILSRNNPSIPHGLPISTSALTTGNLTINGTTTASGAVSLLTTLSVSGAAALNSTLTVSGAASLLTTLSVSGATTLKTTLNVEGATSLSGAVVLGTTLSVSGATVLKATLNVEGATSLSGAVVCGTTLSVSGAAVLGGTLNVSATAVFATVICGNVSASGAMVVGGAFTASAVTSAKINSLQGTTGQLVQSATETIFTPTVGTYFVLIDSSDTDNTAWRGTWMVWASGTIVITAVTTASNTDLINSAGNISVKNLNASTVGLRWAYTRMR